MQLPTVDFCGLNATRMIIGANPFGGFSHQSKERNEEMVAYYTVDRIRETWRRAEAAGINTMITNNTTPHVIQAVREHLAGGGGLQWIAQINDKGYPSMFAAIDEAAAIGAKAPYFHGRSTEQMYHERDDKQLRSWLDRARSHGIPAGVAAHGAEVHLWVDSLGAADFHTVCFFRCGSLHDGQGLKFKLRDMPAAVDCIRRIQKPCIGYKIMAAGRIDPHMAFEYAFDNIKPTDVVNVGIHRGDKDDMVEADVALVRQVLGC